MTHIAREGSATLSVGYPDGGPTYRMQFDTMGRVGSMQDASDNSTVASASYDNGTGLLNSLSYFGFSETRQFNNLLQMTRQTVSKWKQ